MAYFFLRSPHLRTWRTYITGVCGILLLWVKFSPKKFCSFVSSAYLCSRERWGGMAVYAAFGGLFAVMQNVKQWHYDSLWRFLATLTDFLYVYGQLIT